MIDESLTILDCTLRDGGFHCDWDYEPAAVEAYLLAADAAGIDIAEIGYRSVMNSSFAGALKFTDERMVDALPSLQKTRLAVMLDAKEFSEHEHVIDELFRPATASRISVVRVAARVADLTSAERQVSRLKSLGYTTGLNVMAWASLPDERRAEVVDSLLVSAADVVYIADSFGSMFPKDIEAFADLFEQRAQRAGARRPWGVHLHNNLELAFANALTAMQRGATWIDASVLGMGRGPGNLKTEILLQYLERTAPPGRYEAGPVYTLIGRHWQSLHERYRWGPRTPYVLSGFLAVHPSYAQELLESGRYTSDEVIAILNRLHETGTGRSFNRSSLLNALAARTSEVQNTQMVSIDTWRPGSWSQRDVLIVGRGPSAFKHVDAINRFIGSQDPIVIECNLNTGIAAAPDHLVAFVVRANATTMAKPALDAGKAVLVAFDVATLGLASDAPVHQGRHMVVAGQCSPEEGVAPADVVSMFAINTAVARGARRVLLVGFDGYAPDAAPRERRMQAEMEEYLVLLRATNPEVSILSLTPTAFSVPTASIYGSLPDIKASR